MKEELEEGDFDTDGYYHWKRNVNRKNLLSFFVAVFLNPNLLINRKMTCKMLG
jgi:hypothetical protein